MLLKLDCALEAVVDAFEGVMDMLEGYCDVSPKNHNSFRLSVQDCWGGLLKAKVLRWVDFGPDGFDLEEYSTFDNPLNADLHEIVPGKFVAMRGPISVDGGRRWHDVMRSDGGFSHRVFSPAHYAEILQQFDVQAVVRLNAPQYDKQDFVSAGIAVADLFFEDCTSPPVDVVAKFLALAEALPGALAVHCKAGLGRTGTLIALYMMKHHGFSAREAMGWLRIVRPGSVIGEQQAFLCAREHLMRRSCAPLRPKATAEQLAAGGGGAGAVEELIAGVIRDYDASYAAAVRVAVPAMTRSFAVRSSTPAAGITAAIPRELPSGCEWQLQMDSDLGGGGGVEGEKCGALPPAATDGRDGGGCGPTLTRSASMNLAEHVSAATDRRVAARVAGAGAVLSAAGPSSSSSSLAPAPARRLSA